MNVRQKYVAVNAAWPNPLPELTAKEAKSAFRQLYRYRFGKKWSKPVGAVKGKRRRSWTHSGKMIVAPDAGWGAFIHDLSHWVHSKQYPDQYAHKASSHAAVELDLIGFVVRKGWLDGRLKGKPRQPKPQPDPRQIEAERLCAQIKRWESKRKRAHNALVKLNKKLKRLECTKLKAYDRNAGVVPEPFQSGAIP